MNIKLLCNSCRLPGIHVIEWQMLVSDCISIVRVKCPHCNKSRCKMILESDIEDSMKGETYDTAKVASSSDRGR